MALKLINFNMLYYRLVMSLLIVGYDVLYDIPYGLLKVIKCHFFLSNNGVIIAVSKAVKNSVWQHIISNVAMIKTLAIRCSYK